ncbi:MAG: methyl-accepting chemotaxis protein [Cyanobacteria bacterium P01_A01_bin.3]
MSVFTPEVVSSSVRARRSPNRLLVPITVIAGLSLVLVGVSTVNVIRTYRSFRTTVRTDFRLNELSGSIIHIDEVLTMSARMAVSTGDPISRWETRYNEFVPRLDDAIKETIELAPEFADSSEQVDEANIALVDMEVRAFELLGQDRTPEAFELLFSPEYERQKRIYAAGIQTTLTNIKDANALRLASYSRSLSWAATLAGLSVPMLLGSWGVVLWLTRNYIRERNVSQRSLEQSRGQLLQLNEQLEDQVLRRAEQEQAVRWESDVLQQDVGTILNVVSAVEEGDLTVAAPVSDGVTGLVADTLNRLIEELGSILAQVLSTAGQVSQGSDGLERLAKTVSNNAEQQAQSVIQVLELTDRVEAATARSTEQVQHTSNLLHDMQTAVETGESGMEALNSGISVLQAGTDRIVQQMKALGEFVGLADRFVQEQSQIASLTQILAMNAELVASRAEGQRDPRQFLVVAREFEAIAEQVSDLARQTNQGLSSLDKRTNQIHAVVSAIDADVQNLGDLVEQFTVGVEQSNSVFSSIRGATGQVSQAGDAVSSSNRDIVESAEIAIRSLRDIAKRAEETVRLTRQTRERTEAMDTLSAQLLTRVQFFQLPPTTTPLDPELPAPNTQLPSRQETQAPTADALTGGMDREAIATQGPLSSPPETPPASDLLAPEGNVTDTLCPTLDNTNPSASYNTSL